ncbi:MAG: phosphatidylglycerol lysyltransferase domain-containing protein [Oscillospiraceae bacterium]|nr:phosphatidylglycerol lysyltransferase domain-containing protein [Oscillospiraceae bacterium]
MFEFKQVEVSDKEWVAALLKQSCFRGCEYTFGNSYMWSPFYDIQIARYKDFCLFKNKYGFLFPAGRGEIGEAVEVLREYCRENGTPLKFTNAVPESLELLKCLYGEQIQVSTNRDLYDYVYEFDTLSALRGRKLHAKRNHLNRFYENNWRFEPITPDNIEECAAMHNKWCDEKNIYQDSDKRKEAGAVIRGLESFFELGLIGGAIRVDGEIQAYTFGEPSGNRQNDTFVVHVEKAFSKFQGAYTAINREFVNAACQGYKYINREEDMGAENLRKAKMSYCPAFLIEKYCVKLV